MPSWWNWQTRRSKKPVPVMGMRVRVSPMVLYIKIRNKYDRNFDNIRYTPWF